MEPLVESVRVSRNVLVRASSNSFRLQRMLVWEFGSTEESLPTLGNCAFTRQTMAGAIHAGYLASPSTKRETTQSGQVNPLLSYIYSLSTSYHTTHVTPPIMKFAAARLHAAGHSAGATRCLHVAREEKGHDALALKDIAAFGFPAQEFVARIRPGDAIALETLYERLAESDEPIAVFGYVYVLERMALLNTAEFIDTIEQMIPKGINATRCLRVHSAIGSDRRHVDESIAFIASLPRGDRCAIARAAYETSVVMHSESSNYPGDEEMRKLLHALGDEKFHAEVLSPELQH
jgi:hypothetical protein